MNSMRLNKLRDAMKAGGMDAVFVAGPKNVQYVTGLKAMMEGNVQPFNDPEYFAVVQKNRCDVLCDGRYFTEVSGHAGITAQLLKSPVTAKVIGEKVKDLLASGSRTIGYERDGLLYGDATALMGELKGVEWKPAEEILAGLRVRKTPDEIEKIRKAQAITGQAFEHMVTTIRVGMSERDVAFEIDGYLRKHSEGNSFKPIIAFGETGCHPHYTPDANRKLQKGHMVLLDFGAVYDGYCGDMTRMLVMGKADARQKEVYGLVLEAQERCLAGVRPGATCHQLDSLCRDYFVSKGYGDAFMHGTGHGVGLAIHEDPRLKQTFQTVVEPGMVFSVEPGLYFAGWGGVRIEDLVAVTDDGYQNLTTTPKNLVEVAC